MSSAGQTFYAYGAKKAWVARQLTDDSGVNTGPTYGPAREWEGFQKIQQSVQRESQRLIGGGVILGTESELDQIPVQVEIALDSPSVEALIFGNAAWATGDGMRSAVTPDSGNQYCGLWVLTDKTGENGKSLVQFFPRIKFASFARNIDPRSFRTRQISGECAFTKSKFEVWEDGVKLFKPLAVFEYFQAAGDVFNEAYSTAPVLSSSGTLTSQAVSATFTVVMSQLLDADTVNNYTVLLKKGSLLLDAEVRLVTTGGDAYKSFTVDPAANLQAAQSDYTITVTTNVKNRSGIRPAADIAITIATA